MTITTASITALSTGTWTVDPAHTEVGFTARHLMVTKVRGQFKDVEGTVTVAEPFSASQVQATVKLASSTPARPTAMPTSRAPTSSTSRTTRR